MSRPAEGSGRALSRGGWGAAPAVCPLQAGAGHGPAGSPHHYLPSLPPKKHFISRHVTVAIANAHALQVSAPTTTRRCLGSAAAAPSLAPTPNNTLDKQLRRSGHGPATQQIPRGWKLPKSGVVGCITSTNGVQGDVNTVAVPAAPCHSHQGFNETGKLLDMGYFLESIRPVQ